MSWLTNTLKKAEGLLEAVDQQSASSPLSRSTSNPGLHSTAPSIAQDDATTGGESSASLMRHTSMGAGFPASGSAASASRTPLVPTAQLPGPAEPRMSDEELMALLNQPSRSRPGSGRSTPAVRQPSSAPRTPVHASIQRNSAPGTPVHAPGQTAPMPAAMSTPARAAPTPAVATMPADTAPALRDQSEVHAVATQPPEEPQALDAVVASTPAATSGLGEAALSSAEDIEGAAPVFADGDGDVEAVEPVSSEPENGVDDAGAGESSEPADPTSAASTSVEAASDAPTLPTDATTPPDDTPAVAAPATAQDARAADVATSRESNAENADAHPHTNTDGADAHDGDAALAEENRRLGVQNRMLEGEVRALNDEISSLVARHRKTQDLAQNLGTQLRTKQREVFDLQKALQQQRDNEDDFAQALSAKQSAQAALQLELEEARQSARDAAAKAEQLKADLDAVHGDQSAVSKANSAAMDQLRRDVNALQTQLEDEQRAHASTRKQAQERESQLEKAASDYTAALGTAQRQLEEAKAALQRSEARVHSADADVKRLRKEQLEYKQRASSVLANKEAVIEQLQARLAAAGDGSGADVAAALAGSADSQGDGGSGGASAADVVKAHAERDAAYAQLAEAQAELEDLRASMRDVEEQAAIDAAAAASQLSDARSAYEAERNKVRALQRDLLSRAEEVNAVNEELAATRERLTRDVAAMEAEKNKVMKQLTARPSNADLEARLRAMTDSLFARQATIQKLQSEVSSLKLQHEQQRGAAEGTGSGIDDESAHEIHMGGLTRNLDAGPRRRRQRGDDDDDDYAPRPISSLIPEPDDPLNSSRVFHAMRRATPVANMLDQLSTQAGRQLRRSPGFRLGFILYLVVLHLWVFYVLSTFAPELHADGAVPNSSAVPSAAGPTPVPTDGSP